MYHYGGNNPIKYTDPTGEAIAVIPFIAPAVIAGVKAIGAWLGSLFVVGTVATAVGITIDVAIDGSKSENQSDSSTDPSPLIDSGVSSAGAMPPSPDDDEDDKNGDYYESSSKHHQNAKGNISQEPQNAAEMFNKSVKDPNKPNTRWYRDKDGTFHRFQGSNHKYHWNGSTKTGTRMESIPIEIRRSLPKGDL